MTVSKLFNLLIIFEALGFFGCFKGKTVCQKALEFCKNFGLSLRSI